MRQRILARRFRGAGLAADALGQQRRAAEDVFGRAARLADDRAQRPLHQRDDLGIEVAFRQQFGLQGVGRGVAQHADLLHQLWPVTRAVVGDGGVELRDLQGGDAHAALADGHAHGLGGVPVEALFGQNVRIVELTGGLRQVAQTGWRAEAQASRVVGQGPGVVVVEVPGHFEEAGVATVFQKLGKAEQAMAAGEPVPPRQVAVPGAGRQVFAIQPVETAVGGGDGGHHLEDGAGRVKAQRGAVQQGPTRIVLHLGSEFERGLAPHGREGREDVVVVGGVAHQGEDGAAAQVQHHGGRAIGARRPGLGGAAAGALQAVVDEGLQRGVQSQPHALRGAGRPFGQQSLTAAGISHVKPAAGDAAQGLVAAGLDAAAADDAVPREAGRRQGGDLDLVRPAHVADAVGGDRAGFVLARRTLDEARVAVPLQAGPRLLPDERVDGAHFAEPVRRARRQNLLDEGNLKVERRGEAQVAVADVRDVVLDDVNGDDAIVARGQRAARAVVDVGAAGQTRVKPQRAAVSQRGQQVRGRPDHAPVLQARVPGQAQGASALAEAADLAGMENDVVAEGHAAAGPGQLAGDAGLQRLQRHGRLVAPVKIAEGRQEGGFLAAEAEQAVHARHVVVLPGLQKQARDAFGLFRRPALRRGGGRRRGRSGRFVPGAAGRETGQEEEGQAHPDIHEALTPSRGGMVYDGQAR